MTALRFWVTGPERATIPSWAKQGKRSAKSWRLSERSPERTEAILLWAWETTAAALPAQDMADIAKLMENEKEWTIVHGIPEDYFEKEDTTKLPVIRRDLNPWAVGCYTSQIRTKQNHRRLEGLLTEAEKMASEAVLAGVMTYPAEELADAEKSLMFSEFHDILPGSAIQSVEEQALGILSHGAEIADRVKEKSLLFPAFQREKGRRGRVSDPGLQSPSLASQGRFHL